MTCTTYPANHCHTRLSPPIPDSSSRDLSALPQAWCLHETPKYVGLAVLGSKANGGLSSYALSVMVLALFDENGATKLRAPLQVFFKFLQVRITTAS